MAFSASSSFRRHWPPFDCSDTASDRQYGAELSACFARCSDAPDPDAEPAGWLPDADAEPAGGLPNADAEPAGGLPDDTAETAVGVCHVHASSRPTAVEDADLRRSQSDAVALQPLRPADCFQPQLPLANELLWATAPEECIDWALRRPLTGVRRPKPSSSAHNAAADLCIDDDDDATERSVPKHAERPVAGRSVRVSRKGSFHYWLSHKYDDDWCVSHDDSEANSESTWDGSQISFQRGCCLSKDSVQKWILNFRCAILCLAAALAVQSSKRKGSLPESGAIAGENSPDAEDLKEHSLMIITSEFLLVTIK